MSLYIVHTCTQLRGVLLIIYQEILSCLFKTSCVNLRLMTTSWLQVTVEDALLVLTVVFKNRKRCRAPGEMLSSWKVHVTKLLCWTLVVSVQSKSDSSACHYISHAYIVAKIKWHARWYYSRIGKGDTIFTWGDTWCITPGWRIELS